MKKILTILILITSLFIPVVANAETVKLGVVTDIHRCTGRTNDGVNLSMIQNFNNHMNREGVQAVFDLGDNVSYGVNERCNKTAANDLNWVIDRLTPNAPLYHALSDHDIKDRSTFKTWKEKTGTPRTYYSLDIKDVHIIVLDTVTGASKVGKSCSKDKKCKRYKSKYAKYRSLLKNKGALGEYLAYKQVLTGKVKTRSYVYKKKKHYQKKYRQRKKDLDYSHDEDRWDEGQLSASQRKWLKKDLAKTDKTKVVVFSDHPLFSFESSRKKYEINNLPDLTKIFKQSGKQIVSIAGEAHLWEESYQDGIQYYIVDRFKNKNGSWAILEWDNNDYNLRQITSET